MTFPADTYPTVTTELGFNANPGTDYMVFGDETRGLFGTGRFGPDAGLWTDISADLRSVVIKRGHNRATDRAAPSTSVHTVANWHAHYDRENLLGPYVLGGVSQIDAMKRMRDRAAWDGTTYDLWGGYTDDVECGYPLNPNDAFATVPGTDILKVIGNYNGGAIAPVGASELSGARIHRVLDEVGIPDGDRLIDTGEHTLQATTLARPALEEIYNAADSEGGDVFVDASGKLVFKARHWRFQDARSITSQATFGDSGAELRYVNVTRSNNADLVANSIAYSNVGGTEQTAVDLTSQAKYLVRSARRTDLTLEEDSDAELLASMTLFLRKDSRGRFDKLVLAPAKNPSVLWPLALGLRIGDLITVVRRVPRSTVQGDGLTMTVTKYCFVIGIEHDIAPGRWRTTLHLEDATLYRGYLIFGDATRGLFGTGTLAPG